MKRKTRRAIAWTASALWMAVIYMLSAAPGEVSGAQSGGLMELLLGLLSPLWTPDAAALEGMETILRKGAHMAEYAVLFWLYRWALRESGVRRAGAAALMMCVGYAATDEWHQAFVPDRGPAVTDVMIDGCGALLAWGAAAAAGWLIGRRKTRKQRKTTKAQP